MLNMNIRKENQLKQKKKEEEQKEMAVRRMYVADNCTCALALNIIFDTGQTSSRIIPLPGS